MSEMQGLMDRVLNRFATASYEVEGQTWSWLDNAGNGAPVVMLHGSAADALMFVRPMLAFGEHHRIVSISLPALISPFDLARGLAAVIDHLALDGPVLVGSSFVRPEQSRFGSGCIRRCDTGA